MAVVLIVAGCTSTGPRSSEEQRFRKLADAFSAGHHAAQPAAAVALGLHAYDGRCVVPDRAFVRGDIARLERFSSAFAALSPEGLSSAARHDRRLLLAILEGQRFQAEAMRPYEANPMTYASYLDVSFYLKRDWKPLPDRVRDMTAILRQAPALFAVARVQLDRVLARPFVETAIQVAGSTATFLEDDIAKAGRECGDPVVAGEFNVALVAAAREHRAFADWLRRDRLPTATDKFALGAGAYARMLRGELIDLPPAKILELGMKELRAEQARFEEAARLIDPARPAIEVFKAIQKDHPTEQGLLPDTRKNLEAIRQFVVDRRLVTIPSEVRATVTETLPPFRATSFASMETPGPFETKSTEAFYYVTPVEAGWPPAQKEEWLTAFNYYTTDVVSIHEAYPGHYVQFLALNASKASAVAKVFSSYAFVEGWAHYCEKMLLDEGFGQPVSPAMATREEIVRAAKYRLAQSDEALLRVCRLCVSVQMHCEGMTLEQGAKFFRDNCHYEDKPAYQEALRGTFDPGICFYTLGKLQLLKLRSDWQAQEGPAFSLLRFHDEVLRHGMPPVRLLREAMLKDASKHAELF